MYFHSLLCVMWQKTEVKTSVFKSIQSPNFAKSLVFDFFDWTEFCKFLILYIFFINQQVFPRCSVSWNLISQALKSKMFYKNLFSECSFTCLRNFLIKKISSLKATYDGVKENGEFLLSLFFCEKIWREFCHSNVSSH